MDWLAIVGLVIAAPGAAVAVSAELRARRVQQRLDEKERREKVSWELRSHRNQHRSNEVELEFVNIGIAPAFLATIDSKDLERAQVIDPAISPIVKPGEAVRLSITDTSELPGSIRLCWSLTSVPHPVYEGYVRTDDWLPPAP